MFTKLRRLSTLGDLIKANPWVHKKAQPFARWYMDKMGYRQIGLKFDDLLIEESEAVQKSIARLTPREQLDRAWRFRRALHQDVLHRPLPKTEWTKPDEDVRYLTPFIQQVASELDERAAYDNATIKKD